MKDSSTPRAGLDMKKEFTRLQATYYSGRDKELLAGKGEAPTHKEIWKLVNKAERIGDEENLDFIFDLYDSVLYPNTEN